MATGSSQDVRPGRSNRRTVGRLLLLLAPVVVLLAVVGVLDGRSGRSPDQGQEVGDAMTTEETASPVPVATPIPTITAPSPTAAPDDVTELIAGHPDLTELSNLVKGAGLGDTLAGAGPFTMFAPSNEAFAALPADLRDRARTDPETARRLLAYHLVPGLVEDLLTTPRELVTVSRQQVTVAIGTDASTTVNGAAVRPPALDARNGVLYVIGAVLVPPELAGGPAPAPPSP